MNTVVFDYDSAHRLVESPPSRTDVRWENYDLVFFRPDPPEKDYGRTNVRGAYRKGRWGLETRVPVDSDGTWKVPGKIVKHLR